jgi:hypothetical protein
MKSNKLEEGVAVPARQVLYRDFAAGLTHA